MKIICPPSSPQKVLRLATIIFAGLFCSTAQAEITDWVTNEGGRMRVVSLPADENGQVRAALQIEPDQGWITYWKEPGEAGIPPQISVEADSGVSLTSIRYPVPKLIPNGDLRDIGYDHSVTLPFDLKTVGNAIGQKIKLSVFIGICRNICIPFQASFELQMAENEGALVDENSILQLAAASLPEPSSDEFQVTEYHMTPDKTMMGVKLLLPEDAPKGTEIFLTGPSGHAFSEPQNLVRDKRRLSFYMNIKGLPKGYDIRGKSWGILVKSGDRAMETSLGF
jgi:DsbC/DsbD-like thiol-disulfide interchange protein